MRPASVRATRAKAASAALLLLLCFQSCAIKHSAPEVGDTATHWLRRCVEDDACGEGSRCLGAVCTAACDLASVDVCSELHARASCEPLSSEQWGCDLVCTSDASCQSLGAEYACSFGHCRPRSTVAAAIAPRALAAGEVSSESAALTLSDLRWQASVPTVGWHEDHWTVAWRAFNADPNSLLAGVAEEVQLQVAHIDEAGRLDEDATVIDQSTPVVAAKGNDSQVLFPLTSFDACTLDIFDTQSLERISAWADCTSSMSAAQIPGSTDWLLAWTETGTIVSRSIIWLVRFRPGVAGWVAGPWMLGTGPESANVMLATIGDDGLVVWEGEAAGEGVWARGVATVETHEPDAIEAASFAIPPTGSGALRILDTGDEPLVIGADGESLLASKLSASSAQRIATTIITDRPPGIAQVARDRYAICYSAGGRPSSGSQVMLVTIDGQGRVVSAPVVVAEGIENVGGCDLAWSGKTLLVAWWDIAFDAPRTMPNHSLVRARFMKP